MLDSVPCDSTMKTTPERSAVFPLTSLNFASLWGGGNFSEVKCPPPQTGKQRFFASHNFVFFIPENVWKLPNTNTSKHTHTLLARRAILIKIRGQDNKDKFDRSFIFIIERGVFCGFGIESGKKRKREKKIYKTNKDKRA